MATQTQVKAFIERIAPIAQAKSKGRVLPSVCIAQACCESAYGTSPKMIRANALFGIKVGKSKAHFGTAWHDKAYSTRTKECYDGKTYTNITDLFRAYDSIDDAVEDYYDMLGTCKRYKACVNEKNPQKCITAIKNGGYATDPKYVPTVMSIINKYNLTKYDYPTLRKGSSGSEVKELQILLIKAGYSCGKYGSDGKFGDGTLEAVKAFQAEHGLTVDGVVGVNTWNELNR
jgi:flagellum-specific peptidoglycan hydrolase FlgJ|uniref:N acetylmuramidase n=1 Tax=Siphoviridae sp. ctoyo6 TaxID=2825674 RepID=A0A8S5U357_9CAUD|nr:MAG TPA: N acetylmuramidase [Siphoviridae sp. ctoyo6]